MRHFYPDTDISVRRHPFVSLKTHRRDAGTHSAEKCGPELAAFIGKFGWLDAVDSLLLNTSQSFNHVVPAVESFKFIVNLKKLNEVKYLCHFLKDVNQKLTNSGVFVCCIETTWLRRDRIYKQFPSLTGKVVYFFDYLFTRVVPGIKFTRWINKKFTSGHSQTISYYEMLGRLTYCGFSVESDRVINGNHYVAARKVSSPPENVKERYGLLVGLNRVGLHGRIIRVYKFRTMVAFSEYIQEHVYRKNKLRTGGKFRNDKRVTIIGGVFRKLWLDEIPMLMNVFRGDIKLVGVRPLSAQYLALYRPDVIRHRLAVKPGLIPPFYADLPSTLDEIQDSEMRYISRWERAPFRTDAYYFFRAFWNIVARGVRGK